MHHLNELRAKEINMKTIRMICAGALTALLLGCSAEPPSCASAEAKNHIVHRVRDVVSKNVAPEAKKWDTQGLLDGYMKDLVLNVDQITDVSYDAQTKKRACNARLGVETITGAKTETQLQYVMQSVQDNKDQLLFGMRDTRFAVLLNVGLDAQRYVNAHRFNGTWAGTYTCPTYDARWAVGFSVPVEISVMRGSGSMSIDSGFGVREEFAFNFAEGVALNLENGREEAQFPGLHNSQSRKDDRIWLKGVVTEQNARLMGGASDYAHRCTLTLARK